MNKIGIFFLAVLGRITCWLGWHEYTTGITPDFCGGCGRLNPAIKSTYDKTKAYQRRADLEFARRLDDDLLS